MLFQAEAGKADTSRRWSESELPPVPYESFRPLNQSDAAWDAVQSSVTNVPVRRYLPHGEKDTQALRKVAFLVFATWHDAFETGPTTQHTSIHVINTH